MAVEKHVYRRALLEVLDDPRIPLGRPISSLKKMRYPVFPGKVSHQLYVLSRSDVFTRSVMVGNQNHLIRVKDSVNFLFFQFFDTQRSSDIIG